MNYEKKGKLLNFFVYILRKKAEQRGEIKSIVLTLLIKEMREKKEELKKQENENGSSIDFNLIYPKRQVSIDENFQRNLNARKMMKANHIHTE